MNRPFFAPFVITLATTLSLAAPALAQTNVATGSGAGMIVGVVVNDRQEPIARVRVQAFPAGVIRPTDSSAPLSIRAGGSATTDTEGRFQLSGLALDQYIVIAEPVSYLVARRSAPEPIYATTFYPSASDSRSAEPVSAVLNAPTPIQVVLIRARGVRLAGSVVSASGAQTTGLEVSLFHRFGGFGSGSTMTTVDRNGKFEMSGIAPGAYLLT